jgi:hypothetical protein
MLIGAEGAFVAAYDYRSLINFVHQKARSNSFTAEFCGPRLPEMIFMSLIFGSQFYSQEL